MTNDKWKMVFCSVQYVMLWCLGLWLNAGHFRRLQPGEILSELPIPWRDHDRHGAVRLCLTGETNQRLGLCGVDVTELLDFLSFANGHIRKFFGAAQHAHPARAAGS